jgi:hypothetical protein
MKKVVVPKVNNALLSVPLNTIILSSPQIDIKQLPEINLSFCRLFPTLKETYSYYISKKLSYLKSVNASLLKKKKIENLSESVSLKKFELPFLVCFFCEHLECSRESMSTI